MTTQEGVQEWNAPEPRSGAKGGKEDLIFVDSQVTILAGARVGARKHIEGVQSTLSTAKAILQLAFKRQSVIKELESVLSLSCFCPDGTQDFETKRSCLAIVRRLISLIKRQKVKCDTLERFQKTINDLRSCSNASSTDEVPVDHDLHSFTIRKQLVAYDRELPFRFLPSRCLRFAVRRFPIPEHVSRWVRKYLAVIWKLRYHQSRLADCKKELKAVEQIYKCQDSQHGWMDRCRTCRVRYKGEAKYVENTYLEYGLPSAVLLSWYEEFLQEDKERLGMRIEELETLAAQIVEDGSRALERLLARWIRCCFLLKQSKIKESRLATSLQNLRLRKKAARIELEKRQRKVSVEIQRTWRGFVGRRLAQRLQRERDEKLNAEIRLRDESRQECERILRERTHLDKLKADRTKIYSYSCPYLACPKFGKKGAFQTFEQIQIHQAQHEEEARLKEEEERVARQAEEQAKEQELRIEKALLDKTREGAKLRADHHNIIEENRRAQEMRAITTGWSNAAWNSAHLKERNFGILVKPRPKFSSALGMKCPKKSCSHIDFLSYAQWRMHQKFHEEDLETMRLRRAQLRRVQESSEGPKVRPLPHEFPPLSQFRLDKHYGPAHSDSPSSALGKKCRQEKLMALERRTAKAVQSLQRALPRDYRIRFQYPIAQLLHVQFSSTSPKRREVSAQEDPRRLKFLPSLISISKDQLTFGRSTELCDCILDSSRYPNSVSKVHFALHVTELQSGRISFTVSDLGSSSGTFIVRRATTLDGVSSSHQVNNVADYPTKRQATQVLQGAALELFPGDRIVLGVSARYREEEPAWVNSDVIYELMLTDPERNRWDDPTIP